MMIAYQYKLLPTFEQRAVMKRWLDMLRCQYNWLLGDRFDWWRLNRCAVNSCSLVQSIAEPRERPNYYDQKKSLVLLKQDRPWYKEVHSQVLQEMVERVNLAFERFVKGDSKGRRSGKPRFKREKRYRTFCFPQIKGEAIQGNLVKLPKIGLVKFIRHRPIPEGFTVKRVLITRKADAWYITFTLEDKSVPTIPVPDIAPTIENSIGIDAGLEYFVACSDGTLIEPPKFYRQSEDELTKLQRKREKRKERSKAQRKLNERIARLHQKSSRQRRQWHFEAAQLLLDKADVVFVEDLKVGNMARRNKPKQADDGTYLPNGQSAKSGLNKSFADAGISGFLNDILPYKAEKAHRPRRGFLGVRTEQEAGRLVVKVDPRGTSQHCAICLNRVPKELSDRWHNCPHCGASMQRDYNSALLIKKVGLGIASLKNAKSRKRDGEALAVLKESA